MDEGAGPGVDVPTDEGAGRRLVLRDGSAVVVRRIAAEDQGRLAEALARLSPLSRYRRFHAHVSKLSPRLWSYLTVVDGRDHMAWVAVDPARPGEPVLGVARCIRSPEDRTRAEVAVTVLDSHQGLGLGTLLLAVLAAWARANGITTFRALILRENTPMLELLRELEARPLPSDDPRVLCLDVPVPDEPARLGDTPAGRAFKAIASGGGPPPQA